MALGDQLNIDHKEETNINTKFVLPEIQKVLKISTILDYKKVVTTKLYLNNPPVHFLRQYRWQSYIDSNDVNAR